MMDKIRDGAKKIWDSVRRWFRRCAGPDALSLCMLLTAVALVALGRLLGFWPLTLLSMALYIWAFYRMLSHNVAKRREENRRVAEALINWRTAISQWFVRLKNSKKYKYYRCPGCKARLRMPRGIGEKTVICSKCGHSFRQKA